MNLEGTRSPSEGRKRLESKDGAARTAFHASLPAFSGGSTPACCDASASLGYDVDAESSGEDDGGDRLAKHNGGADVNENGKNSFTAGKYAFIFGGNDFKQYDDRWDSEAALNVDLDEEGGGGKQVGGGAAWGGVKGHA